MPEEPDNTDLPTRAPATAPAFVRARALAWSVLAACLAGVWVSDRAGGPSQWWFAAAGVLGLGACAAGVFSNRWWRAATLAGVVCLGGGWAAARFREPAPDRLDRLVADGAIVTIHATATTAPVRRAAPTGPAAPGQWRGDSVRFETAVRSVVGADGGREASGTVLVMGGVGLESLARVGQRLEITGVFGAPGGPTNPGEPDWGRLGNERGRAGSVSVGDGALVRSAGEPGGAAAVWAAALRARQAVRDRALHALGMGAGDAARGGVVGALVLGERDASFDGLYRVFQRAGVAHVLAVSGFHVALLCGLAAAAVRVTGERGRLETLAVVLVVVAMLAFVPARSPIVRAGILALALVLGDLLGRRWDRLTVLAWAGVGLLAWKPSEAFSLGYLLSVGVTALLIAMAEEERRRRWWLLARGAARVGAWRRAGAFGWGLLRLNTACWAVSTPTIIVATGVFSPLAPIATIVIVPFAGVLLVVGWAQAILGVFWLDAAARTLPLVDAAGGTTGAIASWFDALPGSSVLVPGVGWAWAVFTTAAVVGWVFRPSARRVFTPMVCLGVAYAGAMGAVAGRVEGLRVDMFDVGDGTAALVRSGSDALLWDCGGLHREVGDRVADAALALGVRRLPDAVVTHPDMDHFNGLIGVAERMGLRRVHIPAAFMDHRAGGWGETRRVLESMGVTFHALRIADRFDLGRARGEVLWPPEERDPRLMANEQSLVLRLTLDTPAGERTLLLTGDIQRAGIAGLGAAGVDPSATVMEAPHHGSAIPAAIDFVGRAGPAVVLQSSGSSRAGDERWDAVRERTRWLVTARHGAVHAWIRPDGRVESGGFLPGVGSD